MSDNVRQIDERDQWLVDQKGNLVGVKNPTSRGNDLRPLQGVFDADGTPTGIYDPTDGSTIAIGGGVLGTYNTVALLETAFPAASNDGSSALVGLAAPFTLYSSDGVIWYPVVGNRITAITVSRSLTNADNDAILVSASAAAIVLTVPSGLVSGFHCSVFQSGAGLVRFAAGADTVVTNASATFGANTSIALFNTSTDVYNVETVVGQVPLTVTVASAGAIALTTATSANVASIAVPPGSWALNWAVDFVLTAATSTSFKSGVSATSATLPTQAGGSGLGTDPLTTVPLITTLLSDTYNQRGFCSLNVAVNTVVYLVAQQTFSAGSSAAFGTLTLTRV